ACVDSLLAAGTCAAVPNTEFDHFTALPPPNNFAALCSEPNPPCTGAAGGKARLAIDAEGNLLLPVDWSGVLVRSDDVPVPRLLEGGALVAAFEGAADSLQVPSIRFLESFSREGRHLPPLFESRVDGTVADALLLFGSADAAASVLRVSRRS